MTETVQPAVLILKRIVDSQIDPFAAVTALVNQLTTDVTQSNMDVGVDIGHALDAEQSSERAFDLILVTEPSFATWSSSEYQTLRKKYPLARIVTVTGPWSAGGGRSHRQWPGSFYVPLVAFENQFRLFSRQFSNGTPTLWDGPATQSPTERLARGNRDTTPESSSTAPGTIGLIGRDASMLQALATACEALGFQTVSDLQNADSESVNFDKSNPPAYSTPANETSEYSAAEVTPQLWIWDWVNPQQDAVKLELARELSPMIVLLGYAEIQLYSDQLQLTEQPNIKVLRKPFMLDELQAAISDLSLQNR